MTSKKRNSVDADVLVPFLVLVTVTAFHELYDAPEVATLLQESKSSANQEEEEGGQVRASKHPYIIEPKKDGFRVRLLLMEHFTYHRISMAPHDYSYVTFKEVEQQILEANVAAMHEDDYIGGAAS